MHRQLLAVVLAAVLVAGIASLDDVNPGMAGALPPPPGHRCRHLPTGAIAGIAVVAIFIIVVIRICCCFCRTVDPAPPPVRRADVVVELPPVRVRG
jgi:hypothetical protein